MVCGVWCVVCGVFGMWCGVVCGITQMLGMDTRLVVSLSLWGPINSTHLNRKLRRVCVELWAVEAYQLAWSLGAAAFLS